MRVGKFFVSDKTVFEDDLFFLALFHLRFIPLRVECLAWQNRYEYIGISPMFKDIPAGTMATAYDIIIHCNDEGELDSVEVKERNE